MRRGLILAAFVTSLIQPRLSSAQVQTGDLTGTVKDDQGLVLVGAQVQVSSSSLIGGPLTRLTNEKGQFLFPALPPGLYRLDVSMAKFGPYRADDIRIGVGAQIDRSVVLQPQSVFATVTVMGSAADSRDAGFGTRFDRRLLEDIPTRRNGMFAFIMTAPGISPTSQATSFISAFGSGVDQNVFFVDGTNVTAASNGIARSEPGIDFIQEMHVQSVGASAEYGNVQGAAIDIITRQGGNHFLWDATYYGQPRSLSSRPVSRPINGTGPESTYERQAYHDVTTTLGGPIARDRLWFFGGYQYLRDEDSQPGGDPLYPKQYDQAKFFGKLTWRLAPGWQLVQSVHYESWDNRELPTATKRVEATQRLEASVPAVTFGHLTHTTSASVWDIDVGRFAFAQDITRSAGDPSVSGRLDRPTGVLSGAPTQVGELKQTRWTAKATFSHYQTNVLGADHDWKVGGQFDRGEHRSLLVVPTGIRFEDNAPQPTRGFISGPSNAGGLVVSAGVFVTDALRVGNRLTITAGLRFDHSRGISPDIRRLDADGHDTGETIVGDGLLYTWNVLSPRVGAVVKLTADGRTVLRGSYGRFSQGMLTGELSPDHPGVATITMVTVDPVTGSYTNPVSTDPRKQVEIDPGTRAPRTDAYSIGVDREIARVLTVSGVYVHKDGQDFIGWEDVGGTYRKDSTTVNGVTIPVWVLTSPPAERLFTLTNAAGYSLTYDGAAVVVEKRQSHGWQATASYTYSRTSGLQPSSGTTAAGAQVATTGAPPVSFAPPVTFGRDPNTLTNAGGRLPNDRPHLFRLMGSVEVPKAGIMVAANFQYSSGKPWALAADIVPSTAQGVVHVLLEPRGSQRLPSQTVLDVRVSKAWTLGQMGRFELRFDILNLLNDTAAESIESDRYNSPGLGVGNVFLDPRRVMLSVKFNLGR